MLKKISLLCIIILSLLIFQTSAIAKNKKWKSLDYSNNFLRTYIPTSDAIGKMGIKGFFTLWGILSFLETHLPEGLDGKKYVVAIRDLKTSIKLFKQDMLFLVTEIMGARKIDREILKVQIMSITQQLHVIVKTIQYVRKALLNTAYYLFSASINKSVLQRKDYKFSVSLNYLGTDNPWRGWLKRENLYRQIDIAEELELDVVKLNIFLDYWVYHRPKVRKDFAKTISILRKKGFEIYISMEGVSSYYQLDLTFSDRTGEPEGVVNWLTWKHQTAKGVYRIIREFKPEYASILKNPFLEFQEQINQKISVEKWVDYVDDVAANIEKISPKTKVVVEIPLNGDRETEFLKKINDLPHKNIVIGFMIYSIKDFFSIGQFLAANQLNKEIIIAEIWDSVGLYLDSLAEDFMKLGYMWSLDKKFNLFNISFGVNLHTPHFEKTPAFHLYKNIITRASVIGENKEGIKAGIDNFHGILQWRGEELELSVEKPIQ